MLAEMSLGLGLRLHMTREGGGLMERIKGGASETQRESCY